MQECEIHIVEPPPMDPGLQEIKVDVSDYIGQVVVEEFLN